MGRVNTTMRTAICILFLVMVIRGNAQPQAESTSAARVPKPVLDQFNARVPNTTASWTDEGTQYSAAYKDSVELGHIVTFDTKGALLSTQDETARGQFPAGIERFQEEYYPNERYTVWLMTDRDGNKAYYITRNKHTWWFDMKGDVLDRTRNKKVR